MLQNISRVNKGKCVRKVLPCKISRGKHFDTPNCLLFFLDLGPVEKYVKGCYRSFRARIFTVLRMVHCVGIYFYNIPKEYCFSSFISNLVDLAFRFKWTINVDLNTHFPENLRESKFFSHFTPITFALNALLEK